jgi:hypothetical protein
MRLLAALVAVAAACGGSQGLADGARQTIVFEVVDLQLVSKAPLREFTQEDARDLPATIKKLTDAGLLKKLHRCRCSAREAERAEVHWERTAGEDVETFEVAASGTVQEDGRIAFDFHFEAAQIPDLSDVRTTLRSANGECVFAGGLRTSMKMVGTVHHTADLIFVTASYERDPGERADRVWGDRVGDFQLSARTNKPEYAAGEDVVLTLETKNVSPKQARYHSSPVYIQYQFEVLLPDKSKAPLTLYGKDRLESPIADVHGYPLEAGASTSQSVPALNRVFDMTRAGEYQIFVRRPGIGTPAADKARQPDLVSNPVTIRIGVDPQAVIPTPSEKPATK